MLTKNFYSYMRKKFCAATNGSSVYGKFTNLSGVVEEKQSSKDDAGPIQNMNICNAKAAEGVGVYFGSGTTPATPDDYKLENPIATGLSVVAPAGVSFTRGDGYDEYSVTFGVTASADQVIITEIGLKSCSYTYIASGTQANTYNYALFDRTVLDEPITIPAGQSKQVTYTIRFNYGDAA